MKDELAEKIMKKLNALTAKTYSYLKDDNGEYKKLKRTKRCAISRKLKFQNYKNGLKPSQFKSVLN